MLLAGVLSLAQASAVQQRSTPSPPAAGLFDAIETPHVTIATDVQGDGPVGGSRVSLFVDIAPKPRMHVYAPEQKDYIPVSLTLDPNPAFSVQRAVFPKPEKLFFAPLKETQLVYSKPFRIVQDIVLKPQLANVESIKVTGKLRYQACDDAICYLPKNVPVSWTIRRKPASVQ
jgi:DsbC/DsbD-like thiol-disulfide interchange protein